MSQQDREAYKQLVKRHTPHSRFARDTWRAAWVGGAICAAGECYARALMAACGMERADASTLVSLTLVALAVLLTAIGVFDRIGRYAGGGTIVPITGFANSIAAAAMEYRSEGLVLGVGARMFQIAGPVLVYGIGSSVIAGVVYYIIGLMGGV